MALPATDIERLRAWLALLHAPGVGSRTFLELLARCGDPLDLLKASGSQRQAWGISPKLAAYLNAPDWAQVEADLSWLEQPGCHLLTLSDPNYPPLLRQIADPPPILFLRGDAELLTRPQLAMVGSRNPTSMGAQTAREFAAFLAGGGLTITSGLAIGIDGAAHQGALEGGGTTVAVMGTGPDRIYPASHRELAHRIVERGTLVSEFPPGTPPLPGNFPRRNRIISGMALGTIIVESLEDGGAMITASTALDQNREVFAVPGSIFDRRSSGPHKLLREGQATLARTADDVVAELEVKLRPILSRAQKPRPLPPLTLFEQRIHGLLGEVPLHIDAISDQARLSTPDTLVSLLSLEFKGLVKQLPGKMFLRM